MSDQIRSVLERMNATIDQFLSEVASVAGSYGEIEERVSDFATVVAIDQKAAREALAVGPESTISDRGFRHFEAIETDGQEVRVYESSDASAPHLWLSVTGEAFLRETARPYAGCEHGVAAASVSAHMTIDQAGRVRDVLDAAIQQHYQTREEPS